jgi:NAD(P)H-flavin reductase
MLPSVIQWADQVCAAGSPALYRSLAQAIAKYRLRVEDDFAQVWILGQTGCGMGVCQCCTVETRRGQALSCREGPVFRLREVETW